MLDTMYLRTISCLQNTLIYIIIVCKQTSAYHKSSERWRWCVVINRNYSAILATLQITSYALGV